MNYFYCCYWLPSKTTSGSPDQIQHLTIHKGLINAYLTSRHTYIVLECTWDLLPPTLLKRQKERNAPDLPIALQH